MDSLKKIASVILENDNFLLFGHIDPDGDCIGSMVALKEILKKHNKRYDLVFYEKPAEKFNFLLKNDYILFSQLNMNNKAFADRKIIALDAGDKERLGKISETQNDILINIDHHKNNPFFAQYNYVDFEAAAVGEILYDLLAEFNIVINEELGTAIAAAILYDTGFLRYQNTSAKLLRLVADLMDNGVNLYQINNQLFASNPFQVMKLKGKALSTLKIDVENKIAWLYVNNDMLNSTNCKQRDVSGFVNYARDIKEVEVGICFTEISDEQTKVSLRSKQYIPVNKVAETFNGGGHPRAAGCTLFTDLETSIDLILQEVNNFV